MPCKLDKSARVYVVSIIWICGKFKVWGGEEGEIEAAGATRGDSPRREPCDPEGSLARVNVAGRGRDIEAFY